VLLVGGGALFPIKLVKTLFVLEKELAAHIAAFLQILKLGTRCGHAVVTIKSCVRLAGQMQVFYDGFSGDA